MSAQHTPGPWVQHSLMVSEAGQQPGGRDICHCGIGMRSDPYESEANARLIAAAPELLEVLIAFRDGGPNGEVLAASADEVWEQHFEAAHVLGKGLSIQPVKEEVAHG